MAEAAEFGVADALATVETDKALVDVEADAAGVVLKTLVTAGSQVEVGAPIAVLGAPGEQVGDLAALLRELGVEEIEFEVAAGFEDAEAFLEGEVPFVDDFAVGDEGAEVGVEVSGGDDVEVPPVPCGGVDGRDVRRVEPVGA